MDLVVLGYVGVVSVDILLTIIGKIYSDHIIEQAGYKNIKKVAPLSNENFLNILAVVLFSTAPIVNIIYLAGLIKAIECTAKDIEKMIDDGRLIPVRDDTSIRDEEYQLKKDIFELDQRKIELLKQKNECQKKRNESNRARKKMIEGNNRNNIQSYYSSQTPYTRKRVPNNNRRYY